MKYYLMTLLASLSIVMFASVPAVSAGEAANKPQTVSVSLGAEFSSGKYGADSTTRSIYIPFIVTWLPTERIDLSVEIPFIYQSSSTVTTDLYRNSQMTAASRSSAQGGPGGAGGMQSGSGNWNSMGSDTAVSGAGDIILRFGVIALFDSGWLPQLRPSMYLKFPTASSSDGLGTGEFDAGAGAELSKWFGNTTLLGELLYNYQGKAEGFSLKNYLSYTLGAGYQLTAGIKPMLILKGATAPSTYSGELLEARAKVIWSLTDTTSIDLFISHGIADSSPDYGGGIAVIYSF